MKKIIILIIILVTCYATEINKKYIEVVYSGFSDSGYIVDSEDMLCKIKENNKKIVFANEILILNYMYKKGYSNIKRRLKWYDNAFLVSFLMERKCTK